jgi:hypothetical protein
MLYVFLCVRVYVSSWNTCRARSYLGSPRALLFSKTLAKAVWITETIPLISEDEKFAPGPEERKKEKEMT